ncbi:MAG: AMP-binding protein, partial [Symploca sp. SIO3E6]|nr:AMP-binding protein [Caldora sp. SIO3E6]
MEQPLTYLEQRAGEDWLIGYNSYQFHRLTEQLCQQLTEFSQGGTLPKILLAEQNPLGFLAAFLAAVANNCPVFLGNPHWVEQEWRQVWGLVQPDLIFGGNQAGGRWQVAGGSADEKVFTTLNANPSRSVPASPRLPVSPSPRPRVPVSPRPRVPASIFIPTGGSSGKIRFAAHSWQTLMASVAGFHQYFEQKPINSFCVLPLYHVSGLMQFLRSLTTGGRIVIMPFKALTEGRRQKAGSRRQEAGGRRQEAGGRRQMAEGRRQEAGGRWQKAGGSLNEKFFFTTTHENPSPRVSASPRPRVRSAAHTSALPSR